MITSNQIEANKESQRIIDLGKKVEVKEWKATRTGRQNRYYWLCMKVIGDDLGNSKDEIHDYCKKMFITDEFSEILGKKVSKTKTTTTKKTDEFAEYMNQIIVFSHVELGIILPDPAPYDLKRIAEFYKDQINGIR